jgi:hypothetical protein
MVTIVFLFSLLVTGLYFFNLVPGEGYTREFEGLLMITGVLFVVTVTVWIIGVILGSDA